MDVNYNKVFKIGYEKVNENYDAVHKLINDLEDKGWIYSGTWDGKEKSLTIKIASEEQKLWLRFLELGFEEI